MLMGFNEWRGCWRGGGVLSERFSSGKMQEGIFILFFDTSFQRAF